MNEGKVISLDKAFSDRSRPLPPTLAQDVLDLASGLAELAMAVRALATRVENVEAELRRSSNP